MRAGHRDGVPVTVEIETRTGRIVARVWRIAVGRNTLLLLDSNVEGNSPEDRELTARLYGGDQRVRIRQELLLGVGGVRALAALGISPGVVHLNEGHSAFAALELVRRRMDVEGIDADEAMRRVSSQVVFTTHTPVPAGHDRFAAGLVEEHLGPLRDALGLSADGVPSRSDASIPTTGGEEFCMTVLALKTVASRQRRVVAARPCVARDVEAALPGRRARNTSRSGTSPTACTCTPGSRRRCATSTSVTSAPTGPTRGSDTLWEAIDASTMASCGRRIRR